MSSKSLASRAIIAALARKSVRFATIITLLIICGLLLFTWLLATQISPWWWLLLFFILPWAFIALLLWLIVTAFLRKLTPSNMTSKQKHLSREYADKLQRLAETRGMGWPMFAFLSFRDILFYRELRTAKNTLDDSTSLKSDFEKLEKLF